jgi:hypothetical protein
LHTADDNTKEEKQEEEIVVARYKNLDLDSGASKQETSAEGRINEF